MKEFVRLARHSGAAVILSGVQPQPAQVLRRAGLGPKSGAVGFAPDYESALAMVSAEPAEPL